MLGMKRTVILVCAMLALVWSVSGDDATRELKHHHGKNEDMSMETSKGSGTRHRNGGKGHKNNEHGKGKGGSKGDSEGDSKGSGKGDDAPQPDDDEPHDEPPYDDGMSMSMSMTDAPVPSPTYGGDSGKGKGKGGSKSDKGDNDSKSDKGDNDSKSGKKAKKGKKGSKKDRPTMKPVEEPTPAPVTTPPSPAPVMPVAPTPVSPAPTGANSIPIRATPFALFYTLGEERIPSTSEFAELTELTRVYLEEFMFDEFSQTSLTNLDDFLTFMIRNSFTFGAPVQADYRCTGLFNPSSIFLPTVRELNELIDTAFMGDNLAEYLSRVQALPAANVFSTTASIAKGLPDVPIPPSTTEPVSATGSSLMIGGATAAAAGVLVLAAGLIMLWRRQNNGDADMEDFENDYTKNLKGDSTIAGETCNMSLDGSSATPTSWRRGIHFRDNDPIDENEFDEDEFHDEPLSDDEVTADEPRQRSSISTSS